MRLLHVETYILQEFFEPNIPSYAILSHRWETDEVLLADIEQGHFRNKRGWTKIEYACWQAAKDGLEYIWVDTCCIDKTSSAELSEAINSMFRWYQDSLVCYAYLSDVEWTLEQWDVLTYIHIYVPRGISYDVLTARPSSFVNALSTTWFKRGWTLQELIAPSSLRFYDTTWIHLGSRDQHCPLLSQHLEMPQSLLSRNQEHLTSLLRGCSVAQKMSWAATRKTTRLEDRAYSLLGLFDINMPLLYGEGAKAFTRLQEEILKSTTDLSILAWSYSGVILHDDLLANSPDEFYGCGEIVHSDRVDESDVSTATFTMTNRGLRIDGAGVVRYADSTPGTVLKSGLAIDLGCHVLDDVVGALALKIEWVGGQIPYTSQEDERDQSHNPGVALQSLFYVSHDTKSKDRVTRVGCMSHFSRKNIVVARHSATHSARQGANRLEQSNKFNYICVKINVMDGIPTYKVLQFWPLNCWDTKTLTVTLDPERQLKQYNSYYAILLQNGSHKTFVLVLHDAFYKPATRLDAQAYLYNPDIFRLCCSARSASVWEQAYPSQAHWPIMPMIGISVDAQVQIRQETKVWNNSVIAQIDVIIKSAEGGRLNGPYELDGYGLPWGTAFQKLSFASPGHMAHTKSQLISEEEARAIALAQRVVEWQRAQVIHPPEAQAYLAAWSIGSEPY